MLLRSLILHRVATAHLVAGLTLTLWMTLFALNSSNSSFFKCCVYNSTRLAYGSVPINARHVMTMMFEQVKRARITIIH